MNKEKHLAYILNKNVFYANKDRIAYGAALFSPDKHVFTIETMNSIIHLKKLANLNNNMSVLKEKEPRNIPTAQLFFSWYSDVSTEMSLYAYVSYVS